MTPAPATSADPPRELISFRVGAQEFCVDIMSVREIRGWTPATPLPHAPAFVRGVVNLRGAVLPVIDMSLRLGLAPTAPTARHVVIVVWIRGKLIGLLVDAVCDILQIAGESLQPAPDVAADPINSFIAALVTAEDRLLGLIDLDRILPPVEMEAA